MPGFLRFFTMFVTWVASVLRSNTRRTPPMESPTASPSGNVAAGSGRTLAAVFGRAELTLTPSPDLQAAFAAMQERLKVVEGLIAQIAPPDRHGIGGNFPPEPFGEGPLSVSEWATLRQAIDSLKAQSVLPTKKPESTIETVLKTFGQKLLSYLDQYSSAFAKRAGEKTADAILWSALIMELGHELIKLSDAVHSWLHLLSY